MPEGHSEFETLLVHIKPGSKLTVAQAEFLLQLSQPDLESLIFEIVAKAEDKEIATKGRRSETDLDNYRVGLQNFFAILENRLDGVKSHPSLKSSLLQIPYLSSVQGDFTPLTPNEPTISEPIGRTHPDNELADFAYDEFGVSSTAELSVLPPEVNLGNIEKIIDFLAHPRRIMVLSQNNLSGGPVAYEQTTLKIFSATVEGTGFVPVFKSEIILRKSDLDTFEQIRDAIPSRTNYLELEVEVRNRSLVLTTRAVDSKAFFDRHSPEVLQAYVNDYAQAYQSLLNRIAEAFPSQSSFTAEIKLGFSV